MARRPTRRSVPPGTSANGVSAAPARRLVAAAYRSEQEAADKVQRLGPGVDACLFASQVPYEYARRAGTLRVPATYVPLSGSALYVALLRATRELGQDLSRVSVDVLSRADVEDVFAELGVPVAGVHVREDAANAATLAAFHERLWRRDEITVAFTCLQSVAQRLSAADVPVRILRPTSSAIRAALRTATLLAGNRRVERRRNSLWPWWRCPRSGHLAPVLAAARPRGTAAHRAPVPGPGSPADARVGESGQRSLLPGYRDPGLAGRGHRRIPGPPVQ